MPCDESSLVEVLLVPDVLKAFISDFSGVLELVTELLEEQKEVVSEVGFIELPLLVFIHLSENVFDFFIELIFGLFICFFAFFLLLVNEIVKLNAFRVGSYELAV